MKKVIVTKDAPAPIGPYSQAIEANGFLFCSGQIPLDAKTGQIVGENAGEQTMKVMENIRAVLAAGSCSFLNVVKTTIFLQDMADFQEVNEVYSKMFTEAPPARSTVAVRTLPKNVKVEIEVIALKP